MSIPKQKDANVKTPDGTPVHIGGFLHNLRKHNKIGHTLRISLLYTVYGTGTQVGDAGIGRGFPSIATVTVS